MEIQTNIIEFAKEKFNWSQYNESQTREKSLFMKLLKEICSTVEDPKDRMRNPNAIPLKDAIFGLGFWLGSMITGILLEKGEKQ